MTRLAIMLASGLALSGCGDEEPETSPTTPEQIQEQLAEARETVTAAQEGPQAEENPCEVVTEELIRGSLEVPEGAEVEQRRGSGMASTLCTYRWPNPDFDQEAHTREMMKRVQERMRKGGSTEGLMELAMSARESAEVNYTHMPALESAEAAASRFDGIIDTLNRGITREVEAMGKSTKVTVQASTEQVEGVGDQAHWSPRMQQLTVRAGARIFHVSVKVEDTAEANLELTKKLARAIVDRS